MALKATTCKICNIKKRVPKDIFSVFIDKLDGNLVEKVEKGMSYSMNQKCLKCNEIMNRSMKIKKV